MNENILLTKLQYYVDLLHKRVDKHLEQKPFSEFQGILLANTAKAYMTVIKDLKSIIKDAKHD